MDGVPPHDSGATTPVSITVLSVTPMRAGKLFALAAVEVDIDGVLIEIHGIRALPRRRPRPSRRWNGTARLSPP